MQAHLRHSAEHVRIDHRATVADPDRRSEPVSRQSGPPGAIEWQAEPMRIALAQFTAGTDPAENLKLVLAGIDQAVQERADLVVFPEAMICSFAKPRADAAEPWTGRGRAPFEQPRPQRR